MIKPEHHGRHIVGLWVAAVVLLAFGAFILWHFGNAIRLDQ